MEINIVNNTIELTPPQNPVVEVNLNPVPVNGSDGLSAYELDVQEGFNGTLEEWLDQIKNNKLQWSSTDW